MVDPVFKAPLPPLQTNENLSDQTPAVSPAPTSEQSSEDAVSPDVADAAQATFGRVENSDDSLFLVFHDRFIFVGGIFRLLYVRFGFGTKADTICDGNICACYSEQR